MTLLTRGVQIVVFLFAAFGGFFVNIAPPDARDASYATGLSSFVMLIVLMAFASRVTFTGRIRRRWQLTAVSCAVTAVVFAISYKVLLDRFTYPYPPDDPIARHVAGYELTPMAHQFVARSGGQVSPGALELSLPSDQIWTPQSMEVVRVAMLAAYLVLTLAIGTGVFSAIEAQRSKPSKPRAPSRKQRSKKIPRVPPVTGPTDREPDEPHPRATD